MIHSEAKWVTTPSESPIIFGRLPLTMPVKKAKLSISGLGFFEAFINGTKVLEDILVPAWSDYEPRDDMRLIYPLSDRMNHCIYYLVYDVTAQLCSGENLLEVWLGNGWYNQHERNIEGNLWYGMPKLIFSLEWVDAEGKYHVWNSDQSLSWRQSPIKFNNVYYGEIWDFSDIDPSEHPVQLAKPTESPLYHQTCPPDREIQTVIPQIIGANEDGIIWDVGKNIAGYLCCEGLGDIEIRYAEELDSKGNLDFASTGGFGQIQKDCYRCDERRLLKPKFSIKGFRYAQIKGDVTAVKAIVVHADVKVTATFDSSDPTLNWLYDAYLRTQLNNMHCGVVSDCPHRERLGYTGDGQLTCGAAMMLTDSKHFYQKWIHDILDCQDPDTGHVQHTAPFYGGGGGPGGWGGAIVFVPYRYFRQYGDALTLAIAYPQMLKWYDYMLDHCKNDLVVREEEKGWCLGDWCTPEQITIPEPLVNTYYWIKAISNMIEIGEWLGKTERREELIAQMHRSLDAVEKTYCGKKEYVQGEDAFLADLGLLHQDEIERMAAKYDALGGFDTGIFGTYVLIKVLFESGMIDTAYRLLTSHRKNHSFGYMMDRGATTLWEIWTGAESHDHPMFGGVVELLFTELLGIHADEPGYEAITVSPKIPVDLTYVKGSIMTRFGPIRVKYEKSAVPELQVSVPNEINVYGGIQYE